ncbi:MAG: magnesium transporter [Acidimicrobiia bacterium]|nr:MAG: magnesium transporter [Acidimicrobiia bacterium]
MKIRIPGPRAVVETIRDLARSSPDEAEAYLDAHHDEWEELAEYTPENAADILEALPEVGAADLLADLDTDHAGEVLDEMRPEAAADVLESIRPEAAAELIAAMDADQAADLVGALEADEQSAVIAALDPDTAVEIEQLLFHEPDTAGGMMTTEFAILPLGLTVGESFEALRMLHEDLGSNLSYVYVIDDAEKLCGVVSFRDLVFARPGQGIDEVMVGDPVSVEPATDREVVTELIHRYHLLAIPVVDEATRLVGMVRFDEAMHAIQAEAGEDIAVMVGAGEEESVFTPVGVSVRRRLPWILFNLAVGLVIAFVISQFESTLASAVLLAAYMPVVALLSGNSGQQSLAVIIRSIAVGEVPPGRAGRAIRREIAVTTINGLVIAGFAAALGAVTVGAFGQASTVSPPEMAVILFISVVIAFTVAGLVGSGIPILLRGLGQDPAVASTIFLTMFTDLVSFGGFLLIASFLVR